jgi:hypothetical protein
VIDSKRGDSIIASRSSEGPSANVYQRKRGSGSGAGITPGHRRAFLLHPAKDPVLERVISRLRMPSPTSLLQSRTSETPILRCDRR